MPYDALMAEIAAGRRILIDGGTGTEIERHGVVTIKDAWSSTGAADRPDIVQGVHEAYLRAGARIVISNTFSTSRHALRNAGMGDRFEELNRRGVELVRAAIDATSIPALTAGGISHWFWRRDPPSLAELDESVTHQAKIMRDAGADLLMLEMMVDIDKTVTQLRAATRSGLPVWVGFSTTVDDAGTVRLLDGLELSEGVEAIAGFDVDLVSIMHTEVEHIEASLEALASCWDGPTGVYAHSGVFEEPNWIYDGVISSDDYARAAQRWLELGVSVIGGCCGIGPDHIHRLAELDTFPSGAA